MERCLFSSKILDFNIAPCLYLVNNILWKPKSKFTVKFKNIINIKIVRNPSFATYKCEQKILLIEHCINAASNTVWKAVDEFLKLLQGFIFRGFIRKI